MPFYKYIQEDMILNFEPKYWSEPKDEYRVKPIVHDWGKNRAVYMDAIRDFGFGGVVTNPRFNDWATGYDEACNDFAGIKADLEEHGMRYWIYDENGFPSGFADGQTVVGHPELEAKGLYVHRTMAYHPKKYTYHLEDDSDKIVWVAKYAAGSRGSGIPSAGVQYDTMLPVPFDERYVETTLEAHEVLFIFAVRAAHEGSQVTNTPAVGPYINIMNPDATRRFIDLVYEPLFKTVPDAYKDALAVFTDEPSLMVRHMTPGISWPHAIVPWVDGLFEEYEAEYSESILPYLPMLFEGGAEAYPTRIKFYQLVGKLIGRAYTTQLQNWCKEHGTVFSGHYLGEESMAGHVLDYGSYIEVVRQAGYPGMDVLDCIPEIYDYNSAKYPQIVVRKNGTNGMMVEICPFSNRMTFIKDPVENMSGIMGILYLSGVRATNSYFFPNFEEYDPDKLKGVTGLLHRDDAIAFNHYVGRMGYMLDGLSNDCNTFVYYGIESAQALTIPQHTLMRGREYEADSSTRSITKAIYEAGHDFYYADRDDLVAAAACEGTPEISGHEVKTVIVPQLEVLYDESYDALKKLAQNGVKVLFLDSIPRYGTFISKDSSVSSATSSMLSFFDSGNKSRVSGPTDRIEVRVDFEPSSSEDILKWLDENDNEFTAKADGAILLKGRFQKDGRELWFVDNNTRKAVSAVLNHQSKTDAKVYNPVNGSITNIKMGESVEIPSFRGVFIWFN
jgi:hypothetical protein